MKTSAPMSNKMKTPPMEHLHQTKIMYLVALVVAAAAAGIYSWDPWSSTISPRQYLQNPETSLISPLGLICNAHQSLAKLEPSAPDTPSTMFSVLGLDYTKPPFFPPDKCASPIGPNYRHARQAVLDAWAERTDSYDGGRREWRDMFAAASVVLLNDTVRTVYLKEVLPKIQERGEAGWLKVCDG